MLCADHASRFFASASANLRLSAVVGRRLSTCQRNEQGVNVFEGREPSRPPTKNGAGSLGLPAPILVVVETRVWAMQGATPRGDQEAGLLFRCSPRGQSLSLFR